MFRLKSYLTAIVAISVLITGWMFIFSGEESSDFILRVLALVGLAVIVGWILNRSKDQLAADQFKAFWKDTRKKPSQEIKRKTSAYFELDGKVASMIPNTDGGMKVSVPSGMSIAEFMQDGTLISEQKFKELATNRK